MKVATLSALNTGHLYPQVIISIKDWVNPTTIVRPKGLHQWKITMTPSRIECATFRLVAQFPADRRTNTTKPIVALRNFSNASKNQNDTLQCKVFRWRCIIFFTGFLILIGKALFVRTVQQTKWNLISLLGEGFIFPAIGRNVSEVIRGFKFPYQELKCTL